MWYLVFRIVWKLINCWHWSFQVREKTKPEIDRNWIVFPLPANEIPTAYSHVIPYPCQQIEKLDEFSFPPNKPIDGFDDKRKNQMPSSGSLDLSNHLPPRELMPQNTAVWPVFKIIAPRLVNESHGSYIFQGNESDPLAWGVHVDEALCVMTTRSFPDRQHLVVQFITLCL